MYVVWVPSGGIAMKASAGMTRPTPTVVFFLCFGVGAACQALALRHADLGVTYLVVLGLEAVLAAVLGVLIFAEPVTAPKCAGVLVVVGMVLLHLGEAGSPGEPPARPMTSIPD